MPFLNKFKLLFIIAVYLGERTQSLRKHHTKMCPRPQGPLPENPGPLPLSSLGLPSWALRLDRPVMPQYPQHLEFHVLILQVGAGHLLHALHESKGRQRLPSSLSRRRGRKVQTVDGQGTRDPGVALRRSPENTRHGALVRLRKEIWLCSVPVGEEGRAESSPQGRGERVREV